MCKAGKQQMSSDCCGVNECLPPVMELSHWYVLSLCAQTATAWLIASRARRVRPRRVIIITAGVAGLRCLESLQRVCTGLAVQCTDNRCHKHCKIEEIVTWEGVDCWVLHPKGQPLALRLGAKRRRSRHRRSKRKPYPILHQLTILYIHISDTQARLPFSSCLL